MSKESVFLKEIEHALDEMHAIDVTVINVREHTSVTDYMIICSGRSSRHVKAVAEGLIDHMKKAGLPILSQSGLEGGDWALIDFGDFVIHIMQPDSRSFYNLEGLWQTPSSS